MEKYQNNVTDKQGNVVVGAVVEVTTLGGLPAQLYSDNAYTPLSQPLLTDSFGYFSFYANDGRYTITVSTTRATISVTDVILNDPSDNANFDIRAYMTTQVDGVTSNQAGIEAAVAAAYAAGAPLSWPAGTYVSTANIPNFHNVRHSGPGAIKRGSVLFYVDPKEGQTNTLNVATTGSAANDGLGTGQPMATFQNAFDALANYGPVLQGIWSIVAAAGTYTISTGQQTLSTQSVNRVVVRGPAVGHPNVPTCIVDGGGNQANYLHGLSASGLGVRAEFRDIKFQNFTEASGNTRIGCVGENESDFYTNNVHTVSCTWTGIYAFNTVRTRIAGGILDGSANAGAAGIIINSSQCTVGYNAASTAAGPIVKNAGIGIYWSRGTQGHVDFTTIQDCGYGLQIGESSRVDTVGVDFKRNTVGIRCFTGGVYGEGGAPNVWNNGTGDANTTNIAYSAGSGNSDDLLTAQSWTRFGYDRTTRSASGIVSGTFPTVYTLAAYRLQGTGKSLRVRSYGIYTVTAGSTLTINIGGMALTLTVPAAATNAAFELETVLHEVAGGYRAFGTLRHNLASPRMGTATAGFNFAAAQAVAPGYSLTGAGDSLNIYRTDVEIIG